MTTQTSGDGGRSGANRARVRNLSGFGLGGVAALMILGAAWGRLAGSENGEEVAPSSLPATIGCRSHGAGYPRLQWRADVRTLVAIARYLLEPDPEPMELRAPQDERPLPGQDRATNFEAQLPVANSALDAYPPAHRQWPPRAQ